MTLKELECRVAALRDRYPKPPTFEQFQEEWEHMDDLSKAVLEARAEIPEILDSLGEYERGVIGYLKRMGLANNQYTIAEILEITDQLMRGEGRVVQ